MVSFFFSKYKFQLILFVVVILFNLLISSHYYHTTLSLDESTYNGIALAILDGISQAVVLGHVIDIGQEVTPFYPAMIAFAYWIYSSLVSVVVMQVLLNIFTILLLFLTLKIITGKSFLSFLSAGAFIFYFPLWAFNYYVMMEVPTAFLLTLFIYLMSLFFKSNKRSYFFGAVFVMSLLILVNNRFIVLLGAMLLFISILSLRQKAVTFKQFALSLAIVFFVIAPWFIRQYQTYNQFVFFTPLWHNVVASKIKVFQEIDNRSIESHYKSKKLEPKSYEEVLAEISAGKFSSKKLERAEYEALISNQKPGNIYLERLVKYFRIYNDDFRFMYSTGYRLEFPTTLPHKFVNLAFLVPLFLFGFVGAVFGLMKRNQLNTLLSALFLAHLLLHVLINYIDRYRLTILPVLLILAVYGYNESIKHLRKRIVI